jgi:hypothetical protein
MKDELEPELDRNNVPILRGVRAKIADLDRRRVYLEEKLASRTGSRSSLEFAKREVEAIVAAQIALTFHMNTVQRLDEPVGLLREFVAAYEGPIAEEGRLRAVVARGKTLLEEFDALMQGQRR